MTGADTASGFVGRLSELAQAAQLLDRTRLLTLHGPGGIGKTRLAFELVSTRTRTHRQQHWSVDLGALAAPALVPAAVASAIGLNATKQDPLDLVCAHLADQPTLLVLDTCEHLQAAVAPLVQTINDRCARTVVVATSRHRLGLPGEVTFEVPPLTLAADGDRDADSGDAVQLFLTRAWSVDPAFSDDLQTHRIVRDICTRLEGVPLAIELAAARTRALTVEQIRDRLDNPFSLLTATAADASPRQRSLRASIQWSFELCSPQEQELWIDLSFFPGSFDLDAVEAVCGITTDDPDPDSSPTLDLVQALAEKSIIVRHQLGGQMRYRLLDSMRAFGRRQLAGTERLPTLEQAHVTWYSGQARHLEEHWVGPGQATALKRVEADLPNIRQAVEWCLQHRDHTHLLFDLVLMPTAQLWWTAGHVDEGRYWLHRVLDAITERGELRARALRNDIALTLAKGRVAEVGPLMAEARAIEAEVPASERRPGAEEFIVGFGHIMRREYDTAVTVLRDGIRSTQGQTLQPLHLQLRQLLVYALTGMADDDAALAACDDILGISDATGDQYYRAYATHMLALFALGSGDPEQANGLISDALRTSRDFPQRPENPDALMVAGLVAGLTGQSDRAETLFGAAAGTAQTAVALTETFMDAHPQAEKLRALYADLRSAHHTPSWQAGRRMSPLAAVDFALGRSEPLAQRPRDAHLTVREAEVARLVADGMSDRQIARELAISLRTAEGHVARILSKLGYHSRSQIGHRPPR